VGAGGAPGSYAVEAPGSSLALRLGLANPGVRIGLAAGSFLGVVLLPVAGVAAHVLRHRDGLQVTMVTGRKQAIASDAFAAFTDALTAEVGISLDQAAINAVHASMP